jgi:hypothetical protein
VADSNGNSGILPPPFGEKGAWHHRRSFKDFPVKSGVENANYSPAFSDFSTFFADSCTALSAKYTPMVPGTFFRRAAAGCRCFHCSPPRMAGKEAGGNNFLGFAKQNPKLKNGMDAIFEQRKG